MSVRTAEIDGETLYCVRDIMKKLNTGYKGGTFCSALQSDDFKTVKTQSAYMGPRYMKYMTLAQMKIMLRVSKSDKAISVAQEFGIDLDSIVVPSPENVTIGNIMKCFKDKYEMTRQYRVGTYRVDLYIHELNLVVECDENDHRDYDQDKEAERTNYINEKLSPKWVRYNPNGDIFEVINKIIKS